MGETRGLAACSAGSSALSRGVGLDPSPERRELAVQLGALDAAFAPTEVDAARQACGGGADVAIDCSGSEPGRGTAITLVRELGRVVLVGEGNGMTVPDVSPTLLHPSITIIGSWVTSIEHMRALADRLPYWNLHPEVIVSDTFPLADADAAYQLADAGRSGKIALVP